VSGLNHAMHEIADSGGPGDKEIFSDNDNHIPEEYRPTALAKYIAAKNSDTIWMNDGHDNWTYYYPNGEIQTTTVTPRMMFLGDVVDGLIPNATLALKNIVNLFKPLKAPGTGVRNGWTFSRGLGYGSKSRIDYHVLKSTMNSRASSTITIPKYLEGKKLLHWHYGKGNNLKYHRPWEIGPDGIRRW
jgi:hypothetical protein